MQLYTVYFVGKPLYMFRVVSPPIIRSTNKFVSCVLLLVLSCLLCNCCWLTVCIVVADLCVLLSYVYFFFFYFKCRTAGYRSVLGRSCVRPSRHRFFLVSLCPKANAEMVPKIPSCHCMLLIQPSRIKFSSNQFHVLFTCKITTATG